MIKMSEVLINWLSSNEIELRFLFYLLDPMQLIRGIDFKIRKTKQHATIFGVDNTLLLNLYSPEFSYQESFEVSYLRILNQYIPECVLTSFPTGNTPIENIIKLSGSAAIFKSALLNGANRTNELLEFTIINRLTEVNDPNQ